MPRKARLDAEGTLHHVMARGIERASIFRDDRDRESFLERLGLLSQTTGTPVYAFALIPNHFHVLLRSGAGGLSRFMRRLLTGYATSYNRRHRRAGHLFQNRYTSIVCEEGPYFRELIRYIHLNPLRARVVKDVKELESYPWSGHRSLVRENTLTWHDTAYVLNCFGSLKAYKTFIKAGIEKKHVPDLDGGGLVRSLGGPAQTIQRRNSPVLADERILGTDDFVTRLLSQEHHYPSAGERQKKMTDLIEHHCRKAGMLPDALRGGNRAGSIARLRSEIAFTLVKELGISFAEIGRQLGISTSGVSRIMQRMEDESR